MLVGDTLTDRPLNGGAGLALGYLFHDSSAGDCSIYTKMDGSHSVAENRDAPEAARVLGS